jgi:hypothetical protein
VSCVTLGLPVKLKGKFCRTVIRLAILYGAECWSTNRWHVQQLSVAEMRMLWWICGHTRRDRVWNNDMRDWLGVTPVREKLVQHCLRWFGHTQRRSAEAPICNWVIKWIGNEKRGRGWPNLTWEEPVKRDLKDWCITKELALDRSEWKLAFHVPEPWSWVPSFYCLLSSFFSAPFCFFDLAFYFLFSFFDLVFYRPLFSPFFFALVLSLFFWLMWFYL